VPRTLSRAGQGDTESSDPQARALELTELGKALRHLFKNLSRLRGRDTHLGGSDVSHAQFELLIELFERGELPAGELATAAQLMPATVTQMLDHLASSGHVERSRSESDRRLVVCRLTARGRRKVQAKREAWQSRWTQALEGVEDEELRCATRVLERLCTVFDDDPDDKVCAER
jgi:DNA-binding MarR family transcriptional regulator